MVDQLSNGITHLEHGFVEGRVDLGSEDFEGGCLLFFALHLAGYII